MLQVHRGLLQQLQWKQGPPMHISTWNVGGSTALDIAAVALSY